LVRVAISLLMLPPVIRGLPQAHRLAAYPDESRFSQAGIGEFGSVRLAGAGPSVAGEIVLNVANW
ncbi:MAG: hypothetical protein QOG64_1354, partial [Acidimicrobiaceae bacterium]|nr:hypothetical protein [Acidimicrobiaceae bacterium]